MHMSQKIDPCEKCGAGRAHRYQRVWFDAAGEANEAFTNLCVRCARETRRALRENEGEGLTRRELIETLDRFFAASGVFEICARCHQQGTGCCPPTCRVMGAAGCDPDNRRGKTVFCAAFLCSALLNAISECDPDLGRKLRWIKRDLGAAEFPVYEMITRVPAAHRDPLRPLALPARYPALGDLHAEALRDPLLRLADEILEIRRQWSPPLPSPPGDESVNFPAGFAPINEANSPAAAAPAQEKLLVNQEDDLPENSF